MRTELAWCAVHKNDRSLLGARCSFSTWRDSGFPGHPPGLACFIAVSIRRADLKALVTVVRHQAQHFPAASLIALRRSPAEGDFRCVAAWTRLLSWITPGTPARPDPNPGGLGG